MEAIFHIGLHKTGTTSFQRSLALGRDSLYENGILYPEAPVGAAFTDQHADIPLMLQAGRVDAVRAYIQSVLRRARECTSRPIEQVLFSSEEFSNLCYYEGALRAFKAIVSECFVDVRVFAVVRDLVELIASSLRQQLDGGRLMPAHLASEEVILDSLLSVPRKLTVLMENIGPIKFVDYHAANESGDLANYLARIFFGKAVLKLENYRINVSSDRDERLVGLLLSQLRSLVATLNGEHPYSARINAKLAELVDVSQIAKGINSHEALEFAKFYEGKVMDIVMTVSQKHAKTIALEMSKLPKDVQKTLLRSVS